METIEVLKTRATEAIKASLCNEFTKEDGHVMLHVTDLLFNEEGTLDEDRPYQLTSTCKELLGLLTDPEISRKLPEWIRPNIGQNLLNMLSFFERIDDPACTMAFDLYEAKNCDNPDRLNTLIRCYDNKLNEKKEVSNKHI